MYIFFFIFNMAYFKIILSDLALPHNNLFFIKNCDIININPLVKQMRDKSRRIVLFGYY